MYSTDPTLTSAATPTISPVFTLVVLAIILVMLVAMWKLFTKAGQPGWASIVPIYNVYVLLKIVGRPGWWLLLFFIPVVSFVIAIIVYLDLAKSYGRSAVFGVFGLLLFPYVGFPMLAFGPDKYVGPSAADGAAVGSAPVAGGVPVAAAPMAAAPAPAPAPVDSAAPGQGPAATPPAA